MYVATRTIHLLAPNVLNGRLLGVVAKVMVAVDAHTNRVGVVGVIREVIVVMLGACEVADVVKVAAVFPQGIPGDGGDLPNFWLRVVPTIVAHRPIDINVEWR